MPARNKGRGAKNSECTYTTLANAIPQTGFYQSVCGMDALLSNGSMSNDSSFGNNYLCLKIVEQPISVFRYRYKSEKGSHGIIKGESNMRSKKCFPSVKLENISPGCKRKIIIRASLYSSDENDPKPHVYELTGKNCSNGTCDVELDKNSMAVFSTLGITTRKREEVLEILKDRKISEYGSEYDLDLIANEVQEEVKNMNFDSAKLCFEAFFADDLNSPLCEKVFSNPINHQRSTASGDLKIHRVSLCTGKCSGGDEVFLLCEKVKKDDIEVQFFETDETGNLIWMEKGVFSIADVHHQVAIVFKTPKHHQNSVQKTVYIQLYRPSNGKYSEPLKFDYIPDESKFPVSFSDVTNAYGKQSDNLNEILEKPKKRKCAYLDRYEDPNSLEASLSPSMLSNSSGLSPPYDHNKFNLLDIINDLENDSPMIFEDFPIDTPIANMNTVPEQTDFYLPSNTDFKSDQLPSFYTCDIFNECKDYLTSPPYNNFGECATMHPILADGVSADGISADGVDKISDRMGSLSLKENTEKKNVISSKKQKCSEDFKAGINDILKNRNISTFLHHYGPNLVSLQDENGNSILHLAILEQPDNLNLIIKMIEMVPENIINQQNNFHETPLHLATKGNHQKILFALLIEGGNPNIQNQEGDNCLHLAARHNFLHCLKMVMSPTKYGKSKKHKITDLNALNYNGMSALHLSIVSESEDCMNFLLKAKADVNLRESKCGQSPLHLAIEHPTLLLSILKQPGVDVNAKDFREYTPLHLACIKKGKSFKTVFAKFNDDKDMIIKFLESLHPDKTSESESDDDDEYPNYSTDSDCEPEDKSDNETLVEKASDQVNGDIIASQECVQINKNKSNFMKIEEELCEYLDSNDNWKKLAELIGLDIEHVEIFDKGSSAGQTVIKQIKALNDPCDSKVIIELLNIAGLDEGIRILKKDLQSP